MVFLFVCDHIVNKTIFSTPNFLCHSLVQIKSANKKTLWSLIIVLVKKEFYSIYVYPSTDEDEFIILGKQPKLNICPRQLLFSEDCQLLSAKVRLSLFFELQSRILVLDYCIKIMIETPCESKIFSLYFVTSIHCAFLSKEISASKEVSRITQSMAEWNEAAIWREGKTLVRWSFTLYSSLLLISHQPLHCSTRN